MSSEAQRVLAKALLWRSRFNANMGNWELAKQLLQESQALLDSPALADWDTREERVWLHFMLGVAAEPHWEEARRHHEKRLALAQELGWRWASAHALWELGWVELRAGRYDLARQRFQESLRLYRDLGNHSKVVEVLMSLGAARRASGDYDDAQRKFDEGLALARAHGDTWRVADALLSSAMLKAFLGDFEAAAAYERESAALYRDAGDRSGLARALGYLGFSHWFSGEIDQAYRRIEEALAIAEDMQFAREWCWALAHHAWLDVATGKYDEARTYAERFLAHSPEGTPHAPAWTGRAQGVLGWTALAENRYADARRSLREAIAAFHKDRIAEWREYTAWALAALGRAEYGVGNRGKAQQHLFEALEIVVEIRGFIPVLHLMPIITLLLAEEDHAAAQERAVELHALSLSHPFLAKAQLFEDIAWRQVREGTASLPPDVVAAAQARGRALDWWETAEALLDELGEWQ
jgi:tetratricopeptide (TPR) repeat protein